MTKCSTKHDFLLAATALLLFATKAARAQRPSSHDLDLLDDLIVFGDSLSDVGNIFQASNNTIPDPTIYYKGRYSNGRNYVDFLADIISVNVSTANVYAWGGATTNNDYIAGGSTFLQVPVPSVNEQVAEYIDGLPHTLVPVFRNTTQYVVFAGFNDYWFWANRGTGVNLTDNYILDQVADLVTSNLLSSVNCLLSVGATRIVVGDLPPMVDLPDAADNKTDDQLYAYEYLTAKHNFLLKEKIEALTEVTALLEVRPTVRVFSAYAMYKELIADAPWSGYLAAPTVPCLDSNNTMCQDPFAFMGFDLYHPTTQTHHRLAQVVLAAMTDGEVENHEGSKKQAGTQHVPDHPRRALRGPTTASRKPGDD